jgi:hypothetical protein
LTIERREKVIDE